MDHESVQATALKVVFDLLHVFGFEAFHIGESQEELSTGDKQDEVTVLLTHVGSLLVTLSSINH